jgi:hypothetical protein
MVTRKSMIRESSSKVLIVQGKDASLLVHLIKGKLHYYLIVFVGHVYIH